MFKRNRNLLGMLLAFLAGVTLGGARRQRREDDGAEATDVRPPMLEPAGDPLPPQQPRPRPAALRLAVASAFTLLFFAGAAFTAGAGDRLAAALQGDDVVAADEIGAVAAGETPAALVLPADAETPAAEPVLVPAPADTAPEATGAASGPVPVPDTVPDTMPDTVPDTVPGTEPVTAPETTAPAPTAAVAPVKIRLAAAKPAPRKAQTRKWVVKRAELAPARPAEIERAGEPTIWLNRALPDPTPPSARLTRDFARTLARTAAREGADWASLLGVLRAQGALGSVPATSGELTRLAGSLRGDGWRGALALSGRTAFADRAQALADYDRAIGLESLVTGLDASKERLTQRLLADARVTIYPGGRADLEAGRVDVRVVVLLEYLAERHGSVTVSSLFSGHRKYARPGVVSAHVFGHAVDIATVGGLSIAGNQQPGGLTEDAVRSILLLPAELQPQQVISLLGLGGPSFPLADHGDHIHVGY